MMPGGSIGPDRSHAPKVALEYGCANGVAHGAVCPVQVAPLDLALWQGTTLRIVQNYRQSRGDDGNLTLSFTSISEQS